MAIVSISLGITGKLGGWWAGMTGIAGVRVVCEAGGKGGS